MNRPRQAVGTTRPGQPIVQAKQASTPTRPPGVSAAPTLQPKLPAGKSSPRVDLNLKNHVVQLSPGKPWKQNTKRSINSARRRPASEKKAKWLRLWEAKSQLIEDAGYSVGDALRVEKELKKYDMLEYLDDFLELAEIKDLSVDQLLPMIYIASTTKKREFPYPFPSAEDFKRFKNHITELVRILQINYSDLRIQGSALRKTTPGDVDIGIMVDTAEFNRLYNILLGNLVPPANHKRALGQLERARNSGKLSPRDLALLGKAVTGQLVKIFELTKRAMRRASGTQPPLDVQLSVIRLGSSMDTRPYMSF